LRKGRLSLKRGGKRVEIVSGRSNFGKRGNTSDYATTQKTEKERDGGTMSETLSHFFRPGDDPRHQLPAKKGNLRTDTERQKYNILQKCVTKGLTPTSDCAGSKGSLMP